MRSAAGVSNRPPAQRTPRAMSCGSFMRIPFRRLKLSKLLHRASKILASPPEV